MGKETMRKALFRFLFCRKKRVKGKVLLWEEGKPSVMGKGNSLDKGKVPQG